MSTTLFLKISLRRIVVLVALTILVPACASMTQTKNSGYRWGLIGAAVPVGGAIGAATAPDNLDAGYNAAAWAGGMGLIAAVVGEIFFSDKEEINDLKIKAKGLAEPKLTLIEQKTGIFQHPNHPEYTDKTKWNIYQINTWVPDGSSKWKHQDILIEPTSGNKGEM